MVLCVALSIAGCSKAHEPPAGSTEAVDAALESSLDASRSIQTPVADSEYVRVAAMLELTAEEAARLKEAYDARDEELGKWEAAHGERFKELESQIMAAAKARRLAEMRSAIAQGKPLCHELLALVAKHKYQIFTALPKDKRVEWDAHRLFGRLTKVIKPVKLSDDQVEQIRAKSLRAAASIKRPTPDARPLPGAYLAFENAVRSEVLTAEQRQEFEIAKKQSALRSLGW